MGQHLAAVAVRENGLDTQLYLTPGGVAPENSVLITPTRRVPSLQDTVFRFNPAWRHLIPIVDFDRQVSRQLPSEIERFVGFAGHCLASASRARERGCRDIVVVSATSHVDNVLRQHAKASSERPIERPWLNERMAARIRKEYELANSIEVCSTYSFESFLEFGVPEDRLRLTPLFAHPRFSPEARRPCGDSPRSVVYVGRLTVDKGVPLLVEAFRTLPDEDVRLVLVGGWATRGMRKWLTAQLAADRRITVAPGDPLPHLATATMLAHPSYEDGFALAVAEAVAVGAPVIVSADTGAKDLLHQSTGTVIPTGDVSALVDAMRVWLDRA